MHWFFMLVGEWRLRLLSFEIAIYLPLSLSEKSALKTCVTNKWVVKRISKYGYTDYRGDDPSEDYDMYAFHGRIAEIHCIEKCVREISAPWNTFEINFSR